MRLMDFRRAPVSSVMLQRLAFVPVPAAAPAVMAVVEAQQTSGQTPPPELAVVWAHAAAATYGRVPPFLGRRVTGTENATCTPRT